MIRRFFYRAARSPFLWVLVYLAGIDAAVSILFKYPSDPRVINPSSLQRYFDYGRSTEGKLRRMTGRSDADSAPIVAAGWLEAEPERTPATEAARGRPLVTVYGMSHAVQLADELSRTDPSLLVRARGAPGATAAWAHAAFQIDRTSRRPDVAVLGIMTVGVSKVTTTTGLTMSTDLPYPYTNPRYSVVDGHLTAVSPPFLSVAGYRQAFFEADRWRAYRNWLSKHDPYFDRWTFSEDVLDWSSIARLLRRTYAHAVRRTLDSSTFDGKAFNPKSEAVQVLLALVESFFAGATKDGVIPILFLVNNQGTGNALGALLQSTARRLGVAVLNSQDFVDSGDRRNYVPDSHFTPEKNLLLARKMAALIHTQIARRDARSRATKSHHK